MEPFNLKKAQQGEPVCTITGTPVKVLCWDRKVDHYVYIVYLEITHYTDRLQSIPIGYASHYLRMKREK